MTLIIEAQQLQLRLHADGVVRVAGTRVTLETVVTAFKQGATAEEIAQQYDSLELGQIYSVIGFYLQQTAQVENYLREAQRKAEAVQRAHEAQHDPQGIRQRLLARQASKLKTLGNCLGHQLR